MDGASKVASTQVQDSSTFDVNIFDQFNLQNSYFHLSHADVFDEVEKGMRMWIHRKMQVGEGE